MSKVKFEIRRYQAGWGLWINDKWAYGNPKARCDANSVAHIMALEMRRAGLDATYELIPGEPRGFSLFKRLIIRIILLLERFI
jgi:hypothetical protein